MPDSLLQPEERVLPTLERDGSRRWLTPRLAVGAIYRRRRVVAYGLIALLVALPLIRINGMPAVLLDVPNRRFTLLGYTFLPTDTVLLALLMVAWFASIFFTTALLGRAWCGWTCPQTVFLEFAYRPIERLCLGRRGTGGKPRAGLAPWRYVLMYALFALLSLGVTHTLLSYFVGVDQLRQWITGNPLNHPGAFALIAISSIAVFYNFAFFREQMCSIACPYGRFQSVLLDRDSIGVRYDVSRGEPRGHVGKRSTSLPRLDVKRDDCVNDQQCEKCGKTCPAELAATDARDIALAGLDMNGGTGRTGDCVDCSMCVQVCPAGIDIRDGAQLECIHCAQCVDACNAVMTKIGRPTGLIGYRSQASLEGGRTRLVRARVLLYGAISVLFAAALLVLILTKQPFDASLSRIGGQPFVVRPDGSVQNTMRLTLRNRTDAPQTYRLASHTDGVTLAPTDVRIEAQSSTALPLHLIASRGSFPAGKRPARLEITDAHGHTRAVDCELFGPGALP